MRKITTHLTTRMIIGIAAHDPRSCWHRRSPTLKLPVRSPSSRARATASCRRATTPATVRPRPRSLNGSENIADNGTEAVGQTIVASRDGTNVYVIGSADDAAVAEFARNADGSLTEIGCIADSSDSDSSSYAEIRPRPEWSLLRQSRSARTARTCTSQPRMHAGNGDIAEFTRNAERDPHAGIG